MLVPAAAIGAMSTLLVVGLEVLGILSRLEIRISNLISHGKSASLPNTLPVWSVWLATIVFAFWLSFAILSVAGTWRRCVLWITMLVLIAGWAPVLSLAAYTPEVGAPFIAALWSGVCAVVYAGSHRMASDATEASRAKIHPEDTHATH